MKRNGFTLSELLVCLVIFAIIIVIAIPSIISIVNKGKQEQYDMYVKEVLLSAEEYILGNRNDYTSKICDPNCVISVHDLINSGKVDGDIQNPKTGEKLSETAAVVIVEVNGEKFDLTYDEDYQEQ